MKAHKAISLILTTIMTISSTNLAFSEGQVDEIASGSAVITDSEPSEQPNDATKSTSDMDIRTISKSNIAYPVVGGNIYFDSTSGKITDADDSIVSANIPSTINGVNVVDIEDNAFSDCSSLKSVAIPKGVTSIGLHSFSGCSSLTSVDLPDSVAFIGNYAFSKCIRLTNIELSSGVTYYIGNHAFSGCDNLTSIEIPSSVTHIGDGAFSDCKRLSSIEIPNNDAYIGLNAFSNCSSLTNIKLPDNVTSIENGTFMGCESLINIVIPDSVTSIGVRAFQSCKNLKNIEIPASVASIGSEAFYDCRNLTNIVIPDSVTSIEHGTFLGCGSLTNIELPNSITSIGGNAFWSCRNLKNIEIPDSVTSIGSSAFAGCRSLTSIIIPNNITSIESATFQNCDNLTNIVIPGSVASIGSSAFDHCISLTNIAIPDIVTSIGSDAFRDCRSLTNIVIPDSVASIDGTPFQNCSSLTDIIASDNNLNYFDIDGVLFDKATKTLIRYPQGRTTQNYIIAPGTTSIGSSAFADCSNLTNIEIPDSVTSIDGGAFQHCSNLINIKLPDSVTSVGTGTFFQCSSLTNIELPNSITSIGKDAFESCISLINIKIPNNVTSIGAEAFKDCSSLTNIELPSSITSIEYGAFYGCSNLTSIKIPNNVTSIEHSTFHGCSSLTGIEIPNSVTSIDYSAFDGCENLTIYTTPDSYADKWAKENNIKVSYDNMPDDVPPVDENTIPEDIGDSIHFGSRVYEVNKSNISLGNEHNKLLTVYLKNKDDISNISFNLPDTEALGKESISSSATKQDGDSFILLQEGMDFDVSGVVAKIEYSVPVYANGNFIISASVPNGDTAYCMLKVSYFNDGENRRYMQPNITTYCDHDNYLTYKNGHFDKDVLNFKFTVNNEKNEAHNYTAAESEASTLMDTKLVIKLPAGLSFSQTDVLDKTRTVDIGQFTIGSDVTMDPYNVYPTYFIGNVLEVEIDVLSGDKEIRKDNYLVIVESDVKSNYGRVLPGAGDAATYEYLQSLTPEGKMLYFIDQYKTSIRQNLNAFKKAIKNEQKKIEENQRKLEQELKSKTNIDVEEEMISFIESKVDMALSLEFESYPEAKKAMYSALYMFVRDEICSSDKAVNEIKASTDDREAAKNVMSFVVKNLNNKTRSYNVGKYETEFVLNDFKGAGHIAIITKDKVTDRVIGMGTQCTTKNIEDVVENYISILKNLYKDTEIEAKSAAVNGALSDVLSLAGLEDMAKSVFNDPLSSMLGFANIDMSKFGSFVKTFGMACSDAEKIIRISSIKDVNEQMDVINYYAEQSEDPNNWGLPELSGVSDSIYNGLREARIVLIKNAIKYKNGELDDYDFEDFTQDLRGICKATTFNCPVDVIIYLDGQEVGSVIDGTVTCNSNDIKIELNGDSKIVKSYVDGDITAKIIATDYGSLSVTEEYFNPEGYPTERRNYFDIPLYPDKELSLNTESTITDGAETWQANVISPYEDGYVNITTQVENGTVSGNTSYIIGDKVVLMAEPNDGYQFDGWYAGENLLCLDSLYEFTATENLSLTAKFVPAETITEDPNKMGDINGDDIIDSRDSLILFKYIAGDTVTIDESLVDFNKDSTVDSRDSLILFKYVAGDNVSLN